MIGPALRHIIVTDPRTNALVGERVWPGFAPRTGADLPQITRTRIRSNRSPHSEGASGYVAAVFQFNCWATTYQAAEEVKEALRVVLDGRGHEVVEGVTIQHTSVLDEGDIPALNPDSEEQSIHGIRLEVEVAYTEPLE